MCVATLGVGLPAPASILWTPIGLKLLDMHQLKINPAIIKTLCNAFPFGDRGGQGEGREICLYFWPGFPHFLPQKTILLNDDCSTFPLVFRAFVNVKI